jgi:hypothetical protein
MNQRDFRSPGEEIGVWNLRNETADFVSQVPDTLFPYGSISPESKRKEAGETGLFPF